MRLQLMAGLAGALLLTACAGRDPTPVQVAQTGDAARSCAAIDAEIVANNERLGDLGREQGRKVGQNIAAGVAGLVVWPLWFAMDFKGAAKVDQEALEERNKHLAAVARANGC